MWLSAQHLEKKILKTALASTQHVIMYKQPYRSGLNPGSGFQILIIAFTVLDYNYLQISGAVTTEDCRLAEGVLQKGWVYIAIV